MNMLLREHEQSTIGIGMLSNGKTDQRLLVGIILLALASMALILSNPDLSRAQSAVNGDESSPGSTEISTSSSVQGTVTAVDESHYSQNIENIQEHQQFTGDTNPDAKEDNETLSAIGNQTVDIDIKTNTSNGSATSTLTVNGETLDIGDSNKTQRFNVDDDTKVKTRVRTDANNNGENSVSISIKTDSETNQ